MTLPLLGMGPGGGTPVPSLVGANTGGTNFATAHSVDFPAVVNAGNKLILIISSGAAFAWTNLTGWTLEASDTTTSMKIYVYSKTAVGTEGGTTLTFNSSSNINTSQHLYVLSLPNNAITVGIDPAAVGTTNSIDGTGLSGLTSGNYIFIAGSATNRNDNNCNNPPSGYTNLLYQESGTTNSTSSTAQSLATASKYAPGVTAEDPGAWDWIGLQGTVKATVLVACR